MGGCVMRKRLLIPVVVFACAAPGLYLRYQFILDQQCITWQDYGKVRDGMTQPQIEAVLGPPRSVNATPDGGKEVCWIGRKQGMIAVEFSANGTMVQKCYMEEARDYRLSFFPRARE
jgi:hypothetical protein